MTKLLGIAAKPHPPAVDTMLSARQPFTYTALAAKIRAMISGWAEFSRGVVVDQMASLTVSSSPKF